MLVDIVGEGYTKTNMLDFLQLSYSCLYHIPALFHDISYLCCPPGMNMSMEGNIPYRDTPGKFLFIRFDSKKRQVIPNNVISLQIGSLLLMLSRWFLFFVVCFLDVFGFFVFFFDLCFVLDVLCFFVFWVLLGTFGILQFV